MSKRSWIPAIIPLAAVLAGIVPAALSASASHSSSLESTSRAVSPQLLASPPAATALVKRWFTAAKTGKALGIPVSDGQNLGIVQNRWGTVGNGVAAGAGVYFTYAQHHAAFGVNVGVQIFDVRSFSPSVRQLTRAEVVSALGQPGSILYADGTTIYLYPAGANYQLLWAFSGRQARVDHVDVVWPSGTINQMAQDVPNPSIKITAVPGHRSARGSYFSFSIIHAPTGYRLSEIEWVPQSGGAVVAETGSRAVRNAHVSGLLPAFTLTDSHATFYYPQAWHGATGHVQLLYQNVQGSAIVGDSGTITLK